MIPKVIHYCWFGGSEISKKEKMCIKTWKRVLSDYKIVRWDESNFNVNINNYVKQAYNAKKYAFVSDYARFYILYNNGGIYMDTDVEVLKPLDSFLSNSMFAGFEGDENIAPGLIFASTKGEKLIKEILDSYNDRNFINLDGSFNLKTVVEYTTDILKTHGFIANGEFQTVEGMALYPKRYFCPLDYHTNKLSLTTETYTIHHYVASWQPLNQKFKIKLEHLFGIGFIIKLSKFKRFLLGGKQ